MLITKNLLIDLNEVYCFDKQNEISLKFGIKAACKKDITIREDVVFIWELLTAYYNWEINEDSIY